MTLNPTDYGRIVDGAHIAGFLPYLKEAIDKMELQLRNKVFALINSGELSQEAALNYWFELHSYHRLYKRFDQQARIGQAVADEHTAELQH